MARLALLFAVIVAFFAVPVIAMIPSSGDADALSIRDEFKDDDFKITFSKAVQTKRRWYRSQSAGVTSFPMLGATDIQSTVARVALDPDEAYPSHSHPRASETLYLQTGELETYFKFEGSRDPRVVSNVVSYGQVAVFPQGLAHGTKCISARRCVYVSFLTSADAGSTAMPDIAYDLH